MRQRAKLTQFWQQFTLDLILPFHEPRTSFYRNGGPKFEYPNTSEMKN